MRKKIKPEKAFEIDLTLLCKLHNFLFVKIPDTIMTRDKLASMQRRGQSDEYLRPYDGTIITPYGNYPVELKYGYNRLAPHQSAIRNQINKINNTFIVLRKRRLKDGFRYSITLGDNIWYYDTANLNSLLGEFKKYLIVHTSTFEEYDYGKQEHQNDTL